MDSAVSSHRAASPLDPVDQTRLKLRLLMARHGHSGLSSDPVLGAARTEERTAKLICIIDIRSIQEVISSMLEVNSRVSREGAIMGYYSPDFTLEVEEVAGVCPAGEVYANRAIAEGKIPVFSCEGPCIRGEIARLAANLVAREVPCLARACHAETFLVPHSSMARWVKAAEKTVMIDGCFLKCHGRVLKKLIGKDKVVHIDALPLYKKYTDIFLMDDVPEEERNAVARRVADKIIVTLKEEKSLPATTHA